MESEIYHFDFADLEVSVADIAFAMGYQAGAPEPFPQLIEKTLIQAHSYCNIRGGYVIKNDIIIDRKEGTIQVNDISLATHKIITNQIKNADDMAIFVCTMGKGLSDWSQQLIQAGDMLEGYIVDTIGSVAVDLAMDIIQHDLGKKQKSVGIGITHRYSPGYCNWHVSDQQQLFKLLPADFCGIKLSSSSLMEPIKSISGIIGIGKNAVKGSYQCHICEDENCIMRPLLVKKAEAGRM